MHKNLNKLTSINIIYIGKAFLRCVSSSVSSTLNYPKTIFCRMSIGKDVLQNASSYALLHSNFVKNVYHKLGNWTAFDQYVCVRVLLS